MTQGLRRLVRAAEAIEDLIDLDLHRHAHRDLLNRAWKLRENVTAYDAMYVTLPEALDSTVVTCDTPRGGVRFRHLAFEQGRRLVLLSPFQLQIVMALYRRGIAAFTLAMLPAAAAMVLATCGSAGTGPHGGTTTVQSTLNCAVTVTATV